MHFCTSQRCVLSLCEILHFLLKEAWELQSGSQKKRDIGKVQNRLLGFVWPSIKYFKCNRKYLSDFRASELFPELSPLLFFLPLNDSCRRAAASEAGSFWHVETLPVMLSGLFVLGEPWEENSLVATTPEEFIYLSVTGDS